LNIGIAEEDIHKVLHSARRGTCAPGSCPVLIQLRSYNVKNYSCHWGYWKFAPSACCVVCHPLFVQLSLNVLEIPTISLLCGFSLCSGY